MNGVMSTVMKFCEIFTRWLMGCKEDVLVSPSGRPLSAKSSNEFDYIR